MGKESNKKRSFRNTKEIDVSKFTSDLYQVSLLLPASDNEKNIVDVFINKSLERERRSVVTISKNKLLESFNYAQKKEVEANLTILGEIVYRRIYEVLCENEEIRKVQKLMKIYKDAHPDEEKDPTTLKPSKTKKPSKRHTKSATSSKPTKSRKNLKRSKSVHTLDGRTKDPCFPEYVEDSPKIGPSLYIVLCDFYNLNIIRKLQKLEVQVSSFVKIISAPRVKRPTDLPDPADVISDKEKESRTEIDSLWKNYKMIRFDAKKSDFLKDTYEIDYIPPNLNKGESMESFSQVIYDEICSVIFETAILEQQYEHYLESLSFFNINETSDVVFEESYLKNAAEIPLYSFTVPLFLHYILEHVHNVQTEPTPHRGNDLPNQLDPSNSFKKKTEDNIASFLNSENMVKENCEVLLKSIKNHHHIDSGKHVKELLQIVKSKIELLIDQNNKCESKNYNCKREFEIKDPLIFTYGNDIQINTCHIKKPELIDYTEHVMMELKLQKLIDSFEKCEGMAEMLYKYHMQILTSIGEKFDMTSDAIKRMLHMLIFDQMKKHIKATENTEPVKYEYKWYMKELAKRSYTEKIETLDFEHFERVNLESKTQELRLFIENYDPPNEVYQLPEIAFLVKEDNLDNEMIDFLYFETMSGLTLMQSMQKARMKFSKIQYEYFELTDVLLLRFSNPKNTVRESNVWKRSLRSAVCKRDFSDFVIDADRELIGDYKKPYINKLPVKKSKKGRKKSDELIESNIETTLQFEAFDLGDLRLELNGKDTSFYGKHVTIHVNFMNWLYEENRLYIEITMKNHSLYYNNCIGESYKSTPANFHLVMNNGIILAFAKHTPTGACGTSTASPQTNNLEANEGKNSLEFILKATWPNGLHLETVECEGDLHYIRQTRAGVRDVIRSLAKKKKSPSTCKNITAEEYKELEKIEIRRQNMKKEIKSDFKTETEKELPFIEFRDQKKRVFARNGNIIAFNDNRSVLIYCLNGTLYSCGGRDVDTCTNKKSNLFKNMIEYKVITPNGQQIEKSTNHITENPKLDFKIAKDSQNSETYMRRGDGTDIYLKRDQLITTFSDNTRITSTCYIENNLIFLFDENDVTGKWPSRLSNISYSYFYNNEEPWVSVKLVCTFEHPDYATVSYLPHDECLIDMPNDVEVKTTRNGVIEIKEGDVMITVAKDTVLMKDISCQRSNVTIFYPSVPTSSLPPFIMKASDCCNSNEFNIDANGKCYWHQGEEFEQCHCCKDAEFEAFYIINRNLEGEKLLKKWELEKYIKQCQNIDGTIFTDIKNAEGVLQCMQILTPLSLASLNWKVTYPIIIPSMLKAMHLTVPEDKSECNGPFTLEQKESKYVLRQSELLGMIFRHICFIPENSFDNIVQLLQKYTNMGNNNILRWPQYTEDIMVHDPYTTRIAQLVDLHGLVEISKIKNPYPNVDSLKNIKKDIRFPVIGPSPALQQLLLKQASENKRQLLYRDTVRNYISNAHL